MNAVLAFLLSNWPVFFVLVVMSALSIAGWCCFRISVLSILDPESEYEEELAMQREFQKGTGE
jgi:hypothetical protein